jgi:HD-GYP domain-containing protein (c-di-GMP phosphodiesterase class II)
MNSALPHVIVIDGNPMDRAHIGAALAMEYRVSGYEDYRQAASAILQFSPRFVVVDEHVPPLGGREVLLRLNGVRSLRSHHIVATSNDIRGDFLRSARALGAHACLPKPYPRATIIGTLADLSNRHAEASWTDLPELAQRGLRATLDSFNRLPDLIEKEQPLDYGTIGSACSPLIEAVKNNEFKSILSGVRQHDNYSYVHSLRVATMLALFGHALGLDGRDLLALTSGGLLHDVGKMCIPTSILNKPGALDDTERSVPRAIVIIAAQHHERMDGTGYPHGLERQQLNELARMAAIVDVFGALTDRRCYKAASEPEAALAIMAEQMTGHLDTHLLKLFRTVLLDNVSSLSNATRPMAPTGTETFHQ